MTPKALLAIQNEISHLRPRAHEMAVDVRALKLIHKNRAALRQQASDDGVPGSDEAFNAPLFVLEQKADRLIALANRIKQTAEFLRNRKVEDWK